jgi:hypothetical protein
MARNRGDAGEGWDLDLRWPQDSMISPLVPATPRTDAVPADEDHEDGDAPVDPAGEGGDATAKAPVAEVSSADRQRQAFVLTLNPAMAELVADFESLVSTTSTFGNVVDSHLRGYLEEVGLMETVSTGYLKRYRDGHLHALTKLRHLVGDSPPWVQWLADSIREMATAVDDAVEAIRDLSQEARTAVTRSSESVKQMTDAVKWLGEHLQSNLAELHKVVAPDSFDGGEATKDGALSDGETAIQRALTRLSESDAVGAAAATRASQRPYAEREGGASADRLLMTQTRLENEVAHLVEELRGAGGGEVLGALERLAEEIRESGPESVRAEVARLAEEMQAMRRRLNLRARTPVTLETDQLEAIAQAVADTIGGNSGPRRRPLEAPGRASRRATKG